MCNLSQDIKEKGIAEGIREIVFNMHENGLQISQIANYTGKSVAEITAILNEGNSDLESSNIFSM